MSTMIRPVLAVALLAGAALGFTSGSALGQGEGHTPEVVCHWVPADDGSFVRIVVDDDAGRGNNSGQAHAAHENDIFRSPGQLCPDLD